MKAKMLGGAAALLVMLGSVSAMADGPAEVTKDDAGYGYDFKDDLLAAGFAGPAGGSIVVRPGGIRRTLIRPRTSFVREMLKSVEKL